MSTNKVVASPSLKMEKILSYVGVAIMAVIVGVVGNALINMRFTPLRLPSTAKYINVPSATLKEEAAPVGGVEGELTWWKPGGNVYQPDAEISPIVSKTIVDRNDDGEMKFTTRYLLGTQIYFVWNKSEEFGTWKQDNREGKWQLEMVAPGVYAGKMYSCKGNGNFIKIQLRIVG